MNTTKPNNILIGLLLLLVLGIGGYFRFYGLNWDYFSALHPVEGRQVYRIEKADLTKITLTQQPKLAPLNIFPNPSTGLLHIENLPGVETNEISIYSLSGNRCLFKQSNQSEENLDVSLLSPGLYILYVQNKTHRSVHKVMIIQ